MSEVITTACSEIGDDKNVFEKNELYSYTTHMCYHGFLDLAERSMYHDLSWS